MSLLESFAFVIMWWPAPKRMASSQLYSVTVGLMASRIMFVASLLLKNIILLPHQFQASPV